MEAIAISMMPRALPAGPPALMLSMLIQCRHAFAPRAARWPSGPSASEMGTLMREILFSGDGSRFTGRRHGQRFEMPMMLRDIEPPSMRDSLSPHTPPPPAPPISAKCFAEHAPSDARRAQCEVPVPDDSRRRLHMHAMPSAIARASPYR